MFPKQSNIATGFKISISLEFASQILYDYSYAKFYKIFSHQINI